jgi:hypothetical protein
MVTKLGGASSRQRGGAGGTAERAAQREKASALFDRLTVGYADRAGVTTGRIWHNEGMKVHNKIFAMVARGQLVVKVPAPQAQALVSDGVAVAFEPQPGRPLKEWVTVGFSEDDEGCDRWRRLIGDAYAYGCTLDGPKAGTGPRGMTGPPRAGAR